MGILRCFMIKEEKIMMKKMGRSVCLAVIGLLFLLGVRMPIYATETESVMTLQKTVKDAEIKESPEDSAETLREIAAGTGVIVYGEPQDSWSQVEYDGVSGYMESGALELYMSDSEEEALEQEFEAVQEETVRMVEESELIRKSKRTSMIWGGVIAVLVAAIFVVGIVSAIKKEKDEEVEKTGENKEEGTEKTGEDREVET